VIRFILKSLVRGLLILLLIPILLGFLLSSETVNCWLAKQLVQQESRLQFEFNQGHLWRGWDLSNLVWQDDSLTIRIDHLQLAWSPMCLLGPRLCIDSLHIGRLTVLSEPTDEQVERPETLVLPDIRLPLGIQVDDLRIAELWLDETGPLLTDLHMIAHASGSHLMIHRFSGAGPGLDWLLDADLTMRANWPLRLNLSANLPEQQGQPWQADIRAAGSLDQLEVTAVSSGYLQGRLELAASPLQASLPLSLNWRGDDFLALQSLPPTLTLVAPELTLEGSLQNGYELALHADLPGEGGDIRLDLTARAALTGISNIDLLLRVEEDNQRRLQLNGEANWQDELSADAQLEMQAFPWEWLYPQDLGAISLQSLEMQAQLRGRELSAETNARIAGVAEQVMALSFSLAANEQQVRLDPVSMSTEAGSANGSLELDLGDSLAWRAQFELDGLNPGLFVSQLPGSLSGPLTSHGSLAGDELELFAEWALTGTLRAQPLELSGSVNKQVDQWLFEDLLLRQGENRIAGAGRWQDQVMAGLDIELPRLNTLWPGLTGSVAGRIDLSGSASAPRIRADLQAPRLGFNELNISELNLQADVTLSDNLPMDLRLTAQRVRQADQRLGNLDLRLSGNKARHDLALVVERGLLDVDLNLQGRLDATHWRGQLRNTRLAYEALDWRLVQGAEVVYRLAPAQLRVAAHCWSHDAARLCFEGEQRLLPDRQINLALSDFPLQQLAPLLPEDFTWQGDLNARIDLRQALGGQPIAKVDISSRDGQVMVVNADQTLAFPYDSLELTSDLTANRARSRFTLSSMGLGNLQVNADVNDPAGRQTLSGQYRVDGVRLDFLRPFLPQVDSIRGELSGQGELSGVLRDPQIVGDMVLTDGHISGAELPVSFEQLGLRVRIDGQMAGIDGEWQSGEKGRGTLSGSARWKPELDINLQLDGSELPVRVAPYADLSVSPELSMVLADNTLQLTGQISIPEGEITVRELPPQAVKLSPDVIIVGQEPAEDTPSPLDVRANIRLVIGDQLRFSGFGLSGRLSGRINVEENLNASGDLNILDGRYRGYGQRLSLRRAQLLFAGPISQPFLDIEAIRRVDDVVAGLRLTGRAEAPQSEVFSEPGMAQEQALSYLVLGRPLGGDGGDNNMLGQAALALGLAGSAPLANTIAGALGIEGFQLEAEGSGLTTQVVAAGYLTEKLSLRYGVGVFEPANQLALRYDLTKRLYLEAVSGFASSLDFFYRIDF